MLAERSRLRPRAFAPLALALGVHALALGLAAALCFVVPARVEGALETLVIALAERPEPLPEIEPVRTPDAPEFSPSDDIPVIEQAPEELPFDLAAFDLSALPAESVVEAPPVVLDPPEKLTPGAEALGLLSPRIAVKTGPGGAAPASIVAEGSGGGPGGDPAHGGTADHGSGASAAMAIVAAAPRPSVVREPAPLSTPSPNYPRLSRRAGEEGSVLCRLHVSERGKVTEVEVVESSGFARLDDAARATLLTWSFEPRREDGLGVASTLLHRITFRLE